MENVLECQNLSIKYGSKIAVDSFNIALKPGKIVGLLGPNGSGKTTLIKTAMGLIKPSEGEILIDGMKPCHLTKSLISYLPDELYFDKNLKVSNAISLFKDFYSDFDEEKALHMIESLDVKENKKLKQLSKGMLEKVQLSLVMARDAKLFILDEPLGAVDPAARQFILDTILSKYSRNATLLISTHLIQDIEEILDEAIFIKNGKLVLHEDKNVIKEQSGMSLNDYFKEVFKC